jgi:proteasome alpha subunit
MMNQQQAAYDRAITVFSPDGRLYQVEYAREAVKRGTTAIGIKAKDGIVLLVDKRINSRLLESNSVEKIFRIDEHIGVASSGLVGDARSLIDRARVEAQINRISYGEAIDVETLAKKLGDHMQTYTQFGGARPYGTALLIAGVSDGAFRLFETDPSGTLLEYKATGIGTGRPAVMNRFESEYNSDASVQEAVALGISALHDATEGKFELSTIEIGIVDLVSGFRKLSRSEIEALLPKDTYLAEKTEEESEKEVKAESKKKSAEEPTKDPDPAENPTPPKPRRQTKKAAPPPVESDKSDKSEN